MKRFFLFTLIALTLLGCGEGRIDLLTKDVITDAASCYESIEATEDTYLVALDQNCVDLELSGIGGVQPTAPQETLPRERDWELIATL